MLKHLILSFFPSFLQILILKKFRNAKIGKHVKLKLGTVILSDDITIGDHVTIGPFTLIHAEQLTIKNHATIGYLVSLRARYISIGYAASIQPNNRISGSQNKSSKFILGDHSMILPYCYMDPGEGITIGNKTGVGGYSLLFTHGSWPDHLNGGPVSFGPIKIEDNVWLPWRVFILPNVIIGSDSVVGANSLVNKSIPEGSLAGGSPAKVIKEKAYTMPTPEEQIERFQKILVDFRENEMDSEEMKSGFSVHLDNFENIKSGELLFILHHNMNAEQVRQLHKQDINIIDHRNSMYYRSSQNSTMSDRFRSFISKYGIRLYNSSDSNYNK